MKSTFEKLQKLFDRAHGECAYCRRLTTLPDPQAAGVKQPSMANHLRATIDHRTPLSRGGTWQWTNIVLACARCNNLKGDMLPAEWKRYMHDNPRWWALSELPGDKI